MTYDPNTLLGATSAIVVAAIGARGVASDGDVAQLIATTHRALAATGEPAPTGDAAPYSSALAEGAVSVRKSLASPDHIISMIDGKPYKTLRRHLTTNGLTPDEYRARYGLKADYPMVAASYSESRRALAKSIGLGRKPAA